MGFTNENPKCDLIKDQSSSKHKRDWIHNDKLNDDRRIQHYLNLIEFFYSWRRKLVVGDFFGIIRLSSTAVGSPFWHCVNYRYSEFWIIDSLFRVVGLPFYSKDLQDIYRLAVCSKWFTSCKLIHLWNLSVSHYQ